VLFPGLIAPLTLGRQESMLAAQEAVRTQKPMGLLLQRNAETEQPASTDLYTVGTTATILRYVTTPDGAHNLVVQGDKRFRVAEFLEGHPYMAARAEMLPDPSPVNRDIEARMLQVKARAAELLELMPRAPAELVASIEQIQSPGGLADFDAGLIDIKAAEKQDLLETFDVQMRLDRVLAFLVGRIEVQRLSKEIGEQTQGRLEGRQRRFARLLLGLPVRPYLRGVRQLRDALLGVGYRLGGNLRYLEEEGGEHNELAWSRRLPGALGSLRDLLLTAG